MDIESHVPLRPQPLGRPPVYPFGRMEVGDSFVTSATRNRVAAAAGKFGRVHGMKFAIRLDDHGSLRVWRTA